MPQQGSRPRCPVGNGCGQLCRRGKEDSSGHPGYYDGVQDLVTDTLRDYTGGYYRSYDLTIPAAGWKEMAKSVGRYWYSCDVAIEGCDSSYVPMGTLTLDTAGESKKQTLRLCFRPWRAVCGSTLPSPRR